MPWSPASSRLLRVLFMGPSNSGKSSLINALLSKPLCPVSLLSQTTREKMICLKTEGNDQLVMVDTPGINTDENMLRVKRSIHDPWSQLKHADYVMMVLDAKSCFKGDDKLTIDEDVEKILGKLDALKVPSSLILNKVIICTSLF